MNGDRDSEGGGGRNVLKRREIGEYRRPAKGGGVVWNGVVGL